MNRVGTLINFTCLAAIIVGTSCSRLATVADGSAVNGQGPSLLSGNIGETPRSDQEICRLMDLLLSHERLDVELDLELDNQQIESCIQESSYPAKRLCNLALNCMTDGPLLMDIHLRGTTRSDFFLAVRSNSTGRLTGTFRILGCVPTGTGWFYCELQALSI